MSVRISVIVPIYKVEEFIERCATTLLQQTLQKVEFIFVNDATPDGSIAILEKVIAAHPERSGAVRIVHHENNKGLPAARNTGLAYAKGKYIFHCDSDDYVETDMLEQLYNKAGEIDADIVWCDWFLSFENNERYMSQPYYSSPMDALKGILSGAMKYNVWNKLVRRSLYADNDIEFPDGHGMGEDMTMIRLFACAKKVAYVPKAFYHYVKLNTNAYTNTYSERHLLDIKYNVDATIEALENRFGEDLEKEVEWFKLSVKLPFIFTGRKEDYVLWHRWYPESNYYILSNNSLSLRTRLIQWAAWKNQYWIIWLYNQLIFKMVYGVIYR